MWAARVLLPVTLAVVSLSPPLHACGDKFLVGGYSLAYLQVLSSAPPSRILVYWNPDPSAPVDDRTWNPRFEEILEQVGHTIEVVTEETDFRAALERGDADLVLANIGDARELRDEVATERMALLPYMYLPTGNDYRAAKKEFGHALKSPMTVRHLLSTIDGSLRSRIDR